jgi:hypothetical protein
MIIALFPPFDAQASEYQSQLNGCHVWSLTKIL